VIRRLYPIVFLAVLAGSPSRGETPVQGLVDRLRRPPPSTEPFHEVSYRKALKAPLVTSGTYTWFGGLEFERVTSAPFEERARASDGELTVVRKSGKERHLALSRVPALQVLFGGLSAILSGDPDTLERRFEVDLAGDARWRLRLIPRDEALRGRIPSLVLIGEDDRVRCAYFEGVASHTLTLLGRTEAPHPDSTFEALVDRYCPAP
jgi:hypothetical protein